MRMIGQSAAHHRELRAQLVPPLLQAGIIGGTGYLLLGFSGLVDSAIFPVDALIVLGISGACMLMMRRGWIFQAGNWFIVGLMWAVAFNVPFYGINHPVTALYLPVIVVSGLLIGGYFQAGMFVLSAMFVPVWAYLEVTGNRTPPVAVQSWAEFADTVAFWWAAMAATAGCVWLFARRLETATLSARAQTTALAKTMAMMIHTDDVKAFEKRVMYVIAEQLSVEDITLLWLDQDSQQVHGKLYYVDGTVYAEQDMDNPLRPFAPQQVQIWQHITQTRAPFVVNNIASETRLRFRARLMAQGIQSILYIPLMADGTCVGALKINRHNDRPFSAEEILLAESLSQQIMLMMSISQLTLSNRKRAVAAERNRMAQEIHDSLAQGFTGIIAQLEAAQDTLIEDQAASVEHIQRAQILARHSLQEARRSVMALRPSLLDDKSLPEALQQLGQQMQAIAQNVTVDYAICPTSVLIPPDVEHHLLRIAQEALQNAVKHSQACTIRLQFASDEQPLRLMISDDGIGFNVQSYQSGFGLVSMAQRVEAIDGRLAINSIPDRGTTIQVEVSV